MNKKSITILFLNGLLLQPVIADTIQCTAYDAENKQWVVSSNYQLTSINRAFDICKKQSKVPASCKISKEDCEVFIDGMSTRPMWRCMALDQAAVSWFSNIYTHRDDAALAAKAYCRERSTLPETCYIHIFTCRNLNARD